MWNGFVGQRIAATTKTLHRVGMGFLFCALALVLYGARTFINVSQGPFQFDEPKLVAVTNSAVELRNYATVQGRKTITTGITSIEKTTRNGVVESQRTTAEYMAMIVGSHILVVKARPAEKAEKYTGRIVPLPDDLKREVFSNVGDPDLQAATLPVMLDATGGYGDDLVLGYIVIGVLFLSALWALIQSKRRTAAPERHPLCRALLQYGPLYSVVPQIDAEVVAGASTYSSVTYTKNWIISCWLTQLVVMRRDEVVWAYKKRTKHSVNFIPTGSTFSSIIRDSRGKLLEISGSEENVDNTIAWIVSTSPWIIVGYDRKLEKLYKKQRQSFIAAVAERKQRL